MNPRVEILIRDLQLRPHPEGGYYREIFRSEQSVSADGERGKRSALTAIYFLLVAGQCSRWHRVLSDEAWCHLEGDPVTLLCFHAQTQRSSSIQLGAYGPDTEPVFVVPAGVWQAAQPSGEYALVSCYVGPGFEFDDFSLASDHPEVAEAIRAQGQHLDRYL